MYGKLSIFQYTRLHKPAKWYMMMKQERPLHDENPNPGLL